MTTETRMRGTSHCHDCGRPMRQSNQSILEYPGTVIYGGRGRCGTHYKTHRITSKEANGTTAARDARNRMIFNLFIAERRRRGIPEEGLISA